MNDNMTDRDVCAVKTYRPIGSDTTLSSEITKFLYSIFTAETDYTPAQIGYLGNMAITTNGETFVKLYFEPKLCGEIIKDQINFTNKFRPNQALNCLKNWFFVGELNNACTIERRVVKKHRIITNLIDGKEVKTLEFIKEDSDDDSDRPRYKLDRDCQVVALRCNLDLVIAAINNHDLSDPMFNIKYRPVAKTPKASEHVIISNGRNMEFPIHIEMYYNNCIDYNGYDPSHAVPYLMKKHERRIHSKNQISELQRTAYEKAKIADKNIKKKTHTDYLRKYGK